MTFDLQWKESMVELLDQLELAIRSPAPSKSLLQYETRTSEGFIHTYATVPCGAACAVFTEYGKRQPKAPTTQASALSAWRKRHDAMVQLYSRRRPRGDSLDHATPFPAWIPPYGLRLDSVDWKNELRSGGVSRPNRTRRHLSCLASWCLSSRL